MKLELTEFERKLWYLGQIYNRMAIISDNFDKLPLNKSTDEYDMQSIVREYMIIQLANFIDIKKLLESDPAMKTKKHLKECLEPLAAPITSRKETIDRLRNSFYAHVADKVKGRFDGFMEEVIEDKFPKNLEEVVFLALCVTIYGHYFISNFKEEYDAMVEKVESARPLVKSEPHRSYDEIQQELKKIIHGVQVCLKGHSLKYPQAS